MPRQSVGQHGVHELPMTRRPKPPRHRPTVARSISAPVSAVPSDVVPAIVLNSAPTYIAFGYLLLVGVLLAFAKWLVLIIAGFVVFFRVLFWLCERYPRTMFVITAILRGFFSRR
jgi:hypothetical protein